MLPGEAMHKRRNGIILAVAAFFVGSAAWGQQPAGAAAQISQSTLDDLLHRLAAAEVRIQELEQKMGSPSASVALVASVAPIIPPPPAPTLSAGPVMTTPAPEVTTEAIADAQSDPHEHSMTLPGGGPTLKIRGFFDFNYGVGSIANPLVYPVADNGCGTCGNPSTPAHSGFAAGEFDLFISSKISEHLSFVTEVVLGPDATNTFGTDIERYQLTYKANRYFSATGGRFHTSLGYYNTAYHHGNWFSTAEGRPIMYLFEDSGGILPMHMVGASFTGEAPHTEALGLHWVAEIGNGNQSNPAAIAVQNFNSDRNYKATNLAAFIKPQFLPGLQIGGSWYHDGLNPSQASIPLNLPEIRQNIESAYIVYFSSNWEFMNEGVMLSNHLSGTSFSFRSPMAYGQVARKFGIYKPYFRYQYVHDSVHDPVNILSGLYYGPSVGIRVDVSDYAALKLQYNHLFQSGQLSGNGMDAQLAFTF